MNFDTDSINSPQELGAYLKSKRKQSSITLEQMHKLTKIRIKYLKAIEDGSFSEIPGGNVYKKGFLRNYVEVVGLDSKEMLDVFNKIWDEPKNDENIVLPKTEKIIKLNDYLNIPNFRRFSIPFLAAIFFILLIVLIKSFVMRIPQEETIPPIEQEEPVEELSESIQEIDPIEEETEVMVEIVEDTNMRTTYVIDDEIIEVTLNVTTGRCWMSVNKDGVIEYEGSLIAGEKRTWEADNNIKIRIGNPAAIDLTINGKNIGPLSGFARDFIFEKRTF
ncbi:MAG: helix-turn-helix domain-containing protein [Tepidanaerobacteraceae bacterium]|nr:helix-turn-helix domain-containing protein [Thermoanaerobacterales bacterium]